jgi:hypothetical protein
MRKTFLVLSLVAASLLTVADDASAQLLRGRRRGGDVYGTTAPVTILPPTRATCPAISDSRATWIPTPPA